MQETPAASPNPGEMMPKEKPRTLTLVQQGTGMIIACPIVGVAIAGPVGFMVDGRLGWSCACVGLGLGIAGLLCLALSPGKSS